MRFPHFRNFRYPTTATDAELIEAQKPALARRLPRRGLGGFGFRDFGASGSELSETFEVSEVSEVSEGRRETLAAETLVAGWVCATKA
jgi:hypothetical protein